MLPVWKDHRSKPVVLLALLEIRLRREEKEQSNTTIPTDEPTRPIQTNQERLARRNIGQIAKGFNGCRTPPYARQSGKSDNAKSGMAG
jgi:hypothetical protein